MQNAFTLFSCQSKETIFAALMSYRNQLLARKKDIADKMADIDIMDETLPWEKIKNLTDLQYTIDAVGMLMTECARSTNNNLTAGTNTAKEIAQA